MSPLLFAIVLLGFAPPAPSALMSPADVVRTVVDALAHVDSPQPNTGIYTTYQFASPANRRVTGPYGRFLRLVKMADYAALLAPGTPEFGPLSADADHASQTVRIRSLDGGQAQYEFTLSRQSAKSCPASSACWLIDTVRRVP